MYGSIWISPLPPIKHWNSMKRPYVAYSFISKYIVKIIMLFLFFCHFFFSSTLFIPFVTLFRSTSFVMSLCYSILFYFFLFYCFYVLTFLYFSAYYYFILDATLWWHQHQMMGTYTFSTQQCTGTYTHNINKSDVILSFHLSFTISKYFYKNIIFSGATSSQNVENYFRIHLFLRLSRQNQFPDF